MVKQIPMKHIACLSLLSSSMAYAAERPNIIYIFTDQHTANAMSCAGNPDVHPPIWTDWPQPALCSKTLIVRLHSAVPRAAPCSQDTIPVRWNC